MWTSAGVTQTAAKTIILRHLNAIFSCQIQVTMHIVKFLVDGYSPPVFGVYHYEAESGKVKDDVNY